MLVYRQHVQEFSISERIKKITSSLIFHNVEMLFLYCCFYDDSTRVLLVLAPMSFTCMYVCMYGNLP